MKKNNLSEKLLNIYNELDDYMRKNLGVDQFVDFASVLKMMADKNRIFSAYYKDLRTLADLRNLLIHNPYKNHADPLLTPHPYVLQKYEDIKNAIINPKKALSIAVLRDKIYTTTLKSNVVDVIKEMSDKTYTHVGVMENDVMIGIFSENTILSYLNHNKEALFLKDMLVEELADFIPFEKHSSEYFEFVGRNTLVTEIEDIFRLGLKERKRIAVVFITESGKRNEKVIGMLTAWDIAGKNA